MKKLAAFSSLPYKQFPCEKKHDIYFGDEKIYAQYRYFSAPLFDCVASGLVVIGTLWSVSHQIEVVSNHLSNAVRFGWVQSGHG